MAFYSLYMMLMSKNLKTTLRLWRRFMSELFFIMFILVIMVANPKMRGQHYRLNLRDTYKTAFLKAVSVKDLDLFERFQPNKLKFGLAYVPKNDFTTFIINYVSTELKLEYSRGFDTEKELEERFNENTMIAGVVFKNIDQKIDEMGKYNGTIDGTDLRRLVIAIRFPPKFRTVKQFSMQEQLWATRCSGVIENPQNEDEVTQRNIYLSEGFLQIQNEIFSAWLSYLNFYIFNSDDEPVNKNNAEDAQKNDVDKVEGEKTDKEDEEEKEKQKEKEEIEKQKEEDEEEAWLRMYGANVGSSTLKLNAQQRQYLRYAVFLRQYRPRDVYEVCPYYNITKLYTFMFNFMFLFPFCNLIWKMAREREENILVNHWQYGCQYGKHWIAHFIVSFLQFSIINLVIMILLKVPFIETPTAGTFVLTNPWLMLIFLVIHSIALIVMAIFIVVLIIKPTNAVLFAIIIWLLHFGLFFSVLIYDRYPAKSYVYGSILIFFGNSFAYTMHLLKLHSMDNLDEFWLIILTLALNILLYVGLTIFVQTLQPGRYISPKVYNFCGLRSLFTQSSSYVFNLSSEPINKENFEGAPVNGTKMLHVKGVTTFYEDGPDKGMIHLKNLTFRIYANEITVILGHQGAGKTTLIRTLAGWRRPEFGYIYYMDKEVYENWWKLHKKCDVLMPNNPLFDYLTAYESLDYYIRLKIEEPNELTIKAEVLKWQSRLAGIIDEPNILAHNLTFDQRRILCLCCVLALDTPIILLDEPTLHLQYVTKKLFWEILNEEKANRAIVMTTFCYDEAQQIGDRVAILSEGSIIFYGTMFFLEQHHGTYKDLFILKTPEAPRGPINKLITNLVPTAEQTHDINNQLRYRIPHTHRDKYQLLLIKLESNREELGIIRLHMLSPSLSDYYLNIEVAAQKRYTTQRLPIEKKWQTRDLVAKKYLWGNRFSACFFEKVMQQQGRVAAICALAGVIILLIFFNHLLHYYKLPRERTHPIKVGMPHNLEVKTFTNLTTKRCAYVVVPPPPKTKSFLSMYVTERIVEMDSIHCSSGFIIDRLINPTDKLKNGIVQIFFDPNTYYFRCVLWVNQRPFHSAPIVMNFLHNLLLHYIYPNKPELQILLENSPFRMTMKEELELLSIHVPFIGLSITLGSLLPLVIATIIMPIVWIHNSNVYSLLRICGLSDATFWLVTFIWDFLYVIVYSFIILLVLSVYGMKGLFPIHKLYIFFLVLLYFLNTLMFIYLVSIYKHKSEFRAFLWITLLTLLFGIFNFVLYLEVTERNYVFYGIASFFPPFAVLNGLHQVFVMRKAYDICVWNCDSVPQCRMERVCYYFEECCSVDVVTWDGLLKPIIFTIISMVVVLNFLIWTSIRREQLKYQEPSNIKAYHSMYYSFDNPEVVALRKEIASFIMPSCLHTSVCVDQLEQEITRKSHRLNTVSFKLDKGSCLCVYGGRHSGKTQLAKQLVGELGFKFGEVYMCGYDMRNRLHEIRKLIGYCPQTVNLYEYSEVRAYFYLLYMMRGVPEDYIGRKITRLGLMLNIMSCLRRKPYRLTQQEKRKVGFAAALIGYNEVLVLDEPTRGMTATTKREIWNVVRYLSFSGVTIIVLTSDSLECKEIADNVLVFDHYTVLDYNNVINIREGFSLGFKLHVKLRVDGETPEECEQKLEQSIANCNRFVNFLSSESVLVMQKQQYLKFDIPCEKIYLKYSFLYGALEKNIDRLNIAQYRVERMSVEQIFYELLINRIKNMENHERRRAYKRKMEKKKHFIMGFFIVP